MNRLNLISLFLLILFFLSSTYSQNNFCNKTLADKYLNSKGEVYFSFEIFDKGRINFISPLISIDNVIDNTVYAYANNPEFENFLKLNIPYWVLPHPGDADFDVNMQSSPDEIMDWDSYPTYDGYISMMNQFASNYPNLCRIVNGGQTVQGRQILFAVISDNINTPEAEPKFLYTSTMHGDETTGYVLMLRLIDYLLTQYASNPNVANLVNNIEIWVNPLGNPDGTYWGGNQTVNGARRYNANNIDLNRNYPGVDYPGNLNIQPETQIFMNIAKQNYFRLSCNFHGGAEVVNYPWDSWQRLAADDSWWIRVSRKYADTVHAYAPVGYMDDLNNGVTNGYAWYYVHGSRQDYQIYYLHGRESTIELSATKLLPPAQLPNHWNYNYRSFLNYMEQTLYGINGTVTDSLTGMPLKAKVFIPGFDIDSSEVYSDSLFGKYYRMIYQGTYNLTFSAPGYYSKTISNVFARHDSTTVLNVQLKPIFIGITGNNNQLPNDYKLYQNYPNPFNPSTKIKFEIPLSRGVDGASGARRGLLVKMIVYDILGREITTLVNEQLQPGTYEVEWNAANYPSGVYYYKLIAYPSDRLERSDGYQETRKMILIK
ncbi:MAG TPA: M14 family zinc carboxypeptidase [Ignavibacteria bacterium]